MSGKYPVASWKELDALLRRHNFYLKSQKGSHIKYEHTSGMIVVVPRHKVISIGVLKGIIRQISLLERVSEEKLIVELKEGKAL